MAISKILNTQVNTTNATPKVLLSITPVDGETVTLRAIAAGHKSNSGGVITQSAGFWLTATFYKPTGSAVVQVGTTSVVGHTTNPNWKAYLDTDGTLIRLMVKADSGQSATWAGQLMDMVRVSGHAPAL